MRTTKRFTISVLERFSREARGTGAHERYTAWHRVSRGDPSSRGFSSLLSWHGRLLDLLSNGELVAQLFAAMLPDLVDVREQFPLAGAFTLDERQLAFGLDGRERLMAATVAIAEELGYKHPMLREHGQAAPWMMTTDLLLFFRDAGGKLSALAIAIKDNNDWKSAPRKKELLEIEREFWRRHQIPWLLITPEQWDERVLATISRIACWGLTRPVSADSRRSAREIALGNPWASISELVTLIGTSICEEDAGEFALWQAVWAGELPVDLHRTWRPHLPLKHISQIAFYEQNPLAMRRSAWI